MHRKEGSCKEVTTIEIDQLLQLRQFEIHGTTSLILQVIEEKKREQGNEAREHILNNND